MITVFVASGEVGRGITLFPLLLLVVVVVWLLGLVLCDVDGGVAHSKIVCKLLQAAVVVVSLRMVGIKRLLRASLNFCCCLIVG